ncbi:hypothetical protein Kfla_4661 [Kribbella flavida DSM 17836]|uniref:Uncharacterized protein n=1 Tax=Kribbella flavida (strain DSM 17836 / JCM 10339 / NBRC 14399) TaxID=479435 RepID=D2PZ70_KRIFD|nr:hypothetical protein [Kribbella flavida]ADB33679.1 hypothetical protein Kfla_4661 [Kribbella flavida DSM 17836]
MTYNVVVLIEREMSEGDAARVAALHARYDEVVDYHLLVSSHPTEGLAGPMALLGSSFADVAGLSTSSPARTRTAETASAQAATAQTATAQAATAPMLTDRTASGRSTPGRTTTATALADPRFDLASVIEHSARRLRGRNPGQVTVSITHGEVLLALRKLVASTKSREVVVVAWPETAARFVCSNWTARARTELKVPRVRVIEHTT